MVHLTKSSNEAPPRKGSIRSLLGFRSKQDSPRSSIDSTRSSLDIDYSEDANPRGLGKPGSSVNISAAQTNSSMSSNGSTKLRKKSLLTLESSRKPDDNEWERDRVTGEKKDPTNMLHSLAHDFDAPGVGKQPVYETGEAARLATDLTSYLPIPVWQRIVSYLSLADEASLSLAAKPFQTLCSATIIRQLNDPANFRARCTFLHYLDYALPNHLLCYICGTYHVRLNPGAETLRPTNIANPVYTCPYATVTTSDPALRISKARITFGRHLPHPFLQLALRHSRFGPAYGVAVDPLLGRRYKDRETIGTWSHQTRYAIIEDRLMMRVVSSAFAQPNLPLAGKRHLLYSREDFIPFFSVCPHWRDGEMTPILRCALDHIPAPISGSGADRLAKEALQRFKGPQSQIVSQCDFCKPLRRCPECPTEYLVEIRLQEDRTETDLTKMFKQTICVTRWSDCGDGSAPWEDKWHALTSEPTYGENKNGVGEDGRFDSFKAIGRRAISGTFESWFNPEQIPPQRMLSLNPEGVRLGERGHNWY